MHNSGFDRLLAELRPQLYRSARGYTRDHETAEDLVQDVFVRLVRNPEKVQPDRLSVFLHRALINAVIDHVRRRKANPPAVSLDALIEAQGDTVNRALCAPEPVHELLRWEAEERAERWVHAALARLWQVKPDYAAAIVAYDLEEIPYREMPCGAATARQRRSPGMRWLREHVAPPG